MNITRRIMVVGVTALSMAAAPAVRAQYTADFQTNIISGVSSNWSGDYIIGNANSADALVIQNSGMLTDSRGYLGYQAGSSNNSVLVTDNGSVWSNSSNLLIGWSGSHNSVTISNGGQVISLGPGTFNSVIGGGSSSSNRVELTDTGSMWKYRSDLVVGVNGAGNSLVIRNGGNALGIGACIIGSGQGSSNNSVLVTDSGSIWSNASLNVGGGGWGNRLVVSNGAQVLNAGAGYVGTSAFFKFGSNTVLVTDSGSVWSNGEDWTMGGYMWGNSVVVNNGGLLINFNGYVGSYPTSSSNNSMLISDVGSVWTNLGDLRIGGGAARNSLVISNGAKVFNGYGYLGYDYSSSSNNSVVVIGSGSLWTNRNDLSIGYSGARNSLAILSSGVVCSSIGYIGNNATAASNSVAVSGTGSVWCIVNGLYVGNSAAGNSLVISNGGRVVTGYTDSYLGYSGSSSNNSVLVSDTSTVWSNRNSLYIGYDGAGNSLVISNGGVVLSNGGTVGNDSSSKNNRVVVTGAGSVWSNSSGSLFVGRNGVGNSLVISNGGRVFDFVGSVGYSSLSSSNNSVLVTGSGSVWRSDSLTIGRGGSSNSLVINNGGLVVDGSGSIATLGGRNNGVLVTGPGSVWSNTSLSVGDSGNGNSLVVSNGAQVINGDAYVGYNFSAPPLPLSNEVRVADGGVWQNGAVYIGYGGSRNWLVVAGGSVLATSFVVGAASPTCDNFVELDSGGVLTVTNATHDAVLEVRNGELILNSGTVRADILVMTNACGLFVRNGGTLIVGTLVLDPNLDADGDGLPNGWEQQYGLDPLDANGVNGANGDPDGDGVTNLQEFQSGGNPVANIQSITREGDDIRVTWSTAPGKTNALQATAGDADGSYSNNFADIFAVTSNVGTTTNYLDLGTATNFPSRYYRVRLVP